MIDPSVSEMALNVAIDSINSAQKSIGKLDQSNRRSESDLAKNKELKKDQRVEGSPEAYSDTADLESGHLSQKIKSTLSESQLSHAEPSQKTVLKFAKNLVLSSHTLDQSKSLLALQIANDAIAGALASQNKISKPVDKTKRVNPVNTPLLLEKKKMIQEKRTSIELKKKQAAKITATEIQSKKALLDQTKANREDRTKQLSLIKSPDLRLQKELIHKNSLKNAQKIDDKSDQSKNAVNASSSEAPNPATVLAETETNKVELESKCETDLLALDLANAAISRAEKSLTKLTSATSSTEPGKKNSSNQSSNIRTLEKSNDIVKTGQKPPSRQKKETNQKKEKVQQMASRKEKKDEMNQSIVDQLSKVSPKLLQKNNKRIENKENTRIVGNNAAKKESKNPELKTIEKSKLKEKQADGIAIKTLQEKSLQKDYEYNDDFEESSVKVHKKVLKVKKPKPATKPVIAKCKIIKKDTRKVSIGDKKNDIPSAITGKQVSVAPDERKEQVKITRTLLGQQKRKFQIEIGQLKHRIKLLKYQRNPQLDPSIEAKFFPQLARQPYLKSSSCLTISSRVTDSFTLNPPSWNDGIERPKTAPRQRATTDRFGGDDMRISDNRPRTAPPTKPQDLAVGARVCVLLNGQRCLGSLQYFGNLDKYDHMWCGIELDRPLGTHDGIFKKVRYFECAESHGLFVKAERLIPLRSKISY